MAGASTVLTWASLKYLMYLLCSQPSIVSGKVDWCSLPCGNIKNTLCEYSPKENAGNCRNIKSATTKVVRKELLDLHNSYRDRMAGGQIEEKGLKWPNAGDMRQMSWDQDLEDLAFRWGQQCSDNPPHDKCRRTPTFEYSGQNMAYEASSAVYPSANGSVRLWVGEISLTTPSAIVDKYNFGTGQWGHFSQVIWADTYKLGCSAIHAEKRGLKATIVYCNYGPGGNVAGAKVYTRSQTPCDACPSGTKCQSDSVYPHLCALPTDHKAPKDIKGESSQLRIFGTEPKDSLSTTVSFSALLTSFAMKMYN